MPIVKWVTAGLIVLFLSCGTAQAGFIAAFSDVNMWNSPLPSGNDQMALNLLDGGTNSLISSQTGGTDADGLNAFYDAQAGINNTRTAAELTAGLLTGIDLLVLDVGFDLLNPYDLAEQVLIAGFLAGGGNVMLIAESIGVDNINSYNALLAGIGSLMSYQSDDRCCGGFHLADTILPVPLTSGVDTFTLAAANNLLGGSAAIQDQGFTVIAVENFDATPVSEPGTIAIFLLGGTGLIIARRRQRSRPSRLSRLVPPA